MNKKAIGITAAVVIVIIAIIAVVFMLKGKDTGTQVDNTVNSTKDIADTLDKYIDEMDSTEIEDVLNKEPTDEQKDAFEHALDEFAIPDIGSEITVDEEGTAHYTDTAGNEVEVEADQNLISKTDEELEDDYDRMMEELKNYQNINGGNSSNNTSNNNQGNNTNSNTTGNNSLGNGEINVGDDISAEEYAEIERQIREQYIQNGGTIIEGDRGGNIDRETEEYIGTHLKPVN